MDLEKILTRLMESQKGITVVDDCYSDSAVVIAVSSDSMMVCDNPELIKGLEFDNEHASRAARRAADCFENKNIETGLVWGRVADKYRASAAKTVNSLSIRTIKFRNLVGFSV